MRSSITSLGVCIALAAALAGCTQSPGEADAQAKEAQRQADMTAAQAQRQADDTAARAQATADSAARKAQDTFIKAREDYRLGLQHDLDDLSTKIDALTVKASKLSGQRQADMNAAVRSLSARRAAFQGDMVALDTTTAASFEAIKAALNNKLDALKSAVQDTSGRV